MSSAEVCLSSVRRIFVCAGIVTALCVFVLSPVFYPVIMGQETSTPLSLRTDHFSDFKSRAQNLLVLVKKNKLITFCSAEWPTFHVGWPSEGTFDLGTVHQVRDIIFRLRIGHPDQGQPPPRPPPPWVKPFFASTGIFYPSGAGNTCKKKPKESQVA